MDDVSPETRARIEADEQAALLRKALEQLAFVVLSVGLYVVAHAKPGDPHFFFVGLSALPSISTLWKWWQRKRLDPAEIIRRAADDKERAADEEAVKAALAAHRPYFTFGIAGLLVVIALLQLGLAHSLERSIQAAGLVKSSVRTGEWWRLISGTYLHGGAMHLYGNVIALVSLGHIMETYVPRWHLPLVYITAGVLGSAFSFLLLPATSIGASGAILGLAGYLIAVGALEPSRLPTTVRFKVLTMVGLTFYVGAFGFGFIDNAAHIGGALGGALLAFVLTPRGEDHTGLSPRQWNAAGVIAAALIFASAAGTTNVLATSVKRSVPVGSATVALGDDGRNSFVVLENRSDRTLEAYRFNVTLDGQTIAAGWRDDCCFGPVSREQPLAPHSSVRIPVKRTFGVSVGRPKATITLAVFDDGTFKGSREEFDALVKQRKFVADDAAYWRSVIYQQQDANMKLRFDAFTKAYESQRRSTSLGQLAGEALAIPQLIFAAGTNAEAYASLANQAKINLDAIERALRARIAASER
jgi:membrane associated rhomboid family serine protease